MNRVEYRNYNEQVNANVKVVSQFEGETEFLWEKIFDIVDDLTSDEKILKYVNENVVDIKNLDFCSDEFLEIRNESLWQGLEGVHILYEVDLIGGKYTEEHKRLEIIWNEDTESWIMPCYSFGMPWFMRGQMH